MTLSTKTPLYQYQQEVVSKLLPLRIGALYMEMGTGKTRTALELIAQRAAAGKISRVLWLCPCSVKQNLADDLDKHCTGWRDLIRICGIETLSSSDRTYIDLLRYVNNETMCIVDESNLVKNHRAIRTQRITELGKPCRYRLILNGTPVSRNEADLYAQWFFLDRRIFGYRTYWSFAQNHLEYDENGRLRRVLDVDYLMDKIAPWSAVVKKEDVLDLPDKSNYACWFWLTGAQDKHYTEVMDTLLEYVKEDDESTIYRLFTALQLITSGQRITQTRVPLRSEPFFRRREDNPRIDALRNALDEPCADKTIIWVKYRHEAEDVRSVLPAGSHATCTGEATVRQRMREIERFKTDPACKYLVANKVCGGYGLNLQMCHKAVYYNNDFSFATRAQSEDRIHRIGQTHEVYLVDVIALCRIDERIIKCLERKLSMSNEMKREIEARGDLRAWLNPTDTTWPDAGPKTRGSVRQPRLAG